MNVNTILCPTDFSEPSRHALNYALQLARLLDASVRVIHCYGLPTYFALPELALIPSEQYALQVSTAHQEKLNALMAEHKHAGVPLSSALLMGAPGEEIVAEADKRKADMIVIGTRGHGSVPKMLLGSVTERVLRHAHCPVVVVPEPK